VLFAGAATLRSLNRRFRRRDAPADVLSFPGGAPGAEAALEEWHLGDVAIGVPAARRQARAGGHTLAREIQILLLHGYLHLLGYDHETDQGQMERLERRLRRRLGLASREGRSAA
jgi:probable rRNA maturation factor